MGSRCSAVVGHAVQIAAQHVGQRGKGQVLLNGLAGGADDRGLALSGWGRVRAAVCGILQDADGKARLAHACLALQHDQRAAPGQRRPQPALRSTSNSSSRPTRHVVVVHVHGGHQQCCGRVRSAPAPSCGVAAWALRCRLGAACARCAMPARAASRSRAGSLRRSGCAGAIAASAGWGRRPVRRPGWCGSARRSAARRRCRPIRPDSA